MSEETLPPLQEDAKAAEAPVATHAAKSDGSSLPPLNEEANGAAAPSARETPSAAVPKKKLGLKKGSKWGKLKQKRSSLARLAAFDKAKRAVTEATDVERLVEMLHSERFPDRQEAVLGLTRAGVSALKHLPAVVRLLEHEHWTQRLTGLEALASIAHAGPTRDRLAQAEERHRIIMTEVNGNAQRYDRLVWKFRQRKSERIEVATRLSAVGVALPEGISAENESDDEAEPAYVQGLPHATADAQMKARVRREKAAKRAAREAEAREMEAMKARVQARQARGSSSGGGGGGRRG